MAINATTIGTTIFNFICNATVCHKWSRVPSNQIEAPNILGTGIDDCEIFLIVCGRYAIRAFFPALRPKGRAYWELALNRLDPFYKRGIRMVVGVTLVNVVTGYERSVFEALKTISGLRELYHVFGEYDFLVILEVENLPVLSKTVDEIRAVEGVTTTRTVVGAELQDS